MTLNNPLNDLKWPELGVKYENVRHHCVLHITNTETTLQHVSYDVHK